MAGTQEGGCICGAVRYRVRGNPAVGMVCHCRFCQRRLGSAFAFLAYFDDKQVEITQGKLTAYEHRSDESGRWLRLEFCPRCATSITHTVEVRPGMRGIAAGTFDDPDWFRVERHIWTRSKRPWVAIPAGVESLPKGSPAGALPQPASPLYEVERRAEHAARPGFRITELQISKSQTVPWHYHSNVQDAFYVLKGNLRIFLQDPKEEVRLAPGETFSVKPRRAHLVTNAGEDSATFLVLQGIGEYDFVPLLEKDRR